MAEDLGIILNRFAVMAVMFRRCCHSGRAAVVPARLRPRGAGNHAAGRG